MKYNDNEIMDQIESQVQHVLRMYERHELEAILIELCHGWFFKGFNTGFNLERGFNDKS